MRIYFLLMFWPMSFGLAQQATAPFQESTELTKQADSLMTLGKYKEAIDYLNDAIYKAPDNYAAYLLRAQSKYIIKAYAEAFRDYQAVLTMDLGQEDKQALAYANLGIGTYYNRLENYREAIRYFKVAKALDSTDIRTYDGLVYSYLSLSEYDDALTELTALLKVSPHYKEAYLSRGIVYLLKKQYQLAIADFDQAIALDTEYVAAYHNRGKAKKALGDKIGCCQDWQKCYTLGMNSIKLNLKTVCN